MNFQKIREKARAISLNRKFQFGLFQFSMWLLLSEFKVYNNPFADMVLVTGIMFTVHFRADTRYYQGKADMAKEFDKVLTERGEKFKQTMDDIMSQYGLHPTEEVKNERVLH